MMYISHNGEENNLLVLLSSKDKYDQQGLGLQRILRILRINIGLYGFIQACLFCLRKNRMLESTCHKDKTESETGRLKKNPGPSNDKLS